MQHTIRDHLVLALFLMLGTRTFAQLAPSVFTYQGALRQNGENANVSVPMSFRLYDAPSGGSQIGSGVSFGSVDVADGLFSVRLDFGAVASSTNAMWLEIEVDGFVMLPREAITASPYALQTRGIHVDTGGDVGIGTTTPDADFEVREEDASIRVRSTNGNSTARVELMGELPSPVGGIYSSVDFLDASGTLRFGIQHDNAFFSEYLTVFTPDFPSGLIRVQDTGLIAIGDVPSIASVHLTDRDIGIYNDGMLNETLALEDNDAVLGIYSSNTGSFGSALVFGESVGNALIDKWGMVRTTSNAAPELRVTYGSNSNYAQNAASVTFVPGGLKFADGSVQTTASSIVDIGDFVPSGGSVRLNGSVLVGKHEVVISEQGQSIFVVGTANGILDGEGTIQVTIGYRPVGSGSVSLAGVFQTVSSNDQGSTLEQWNWCGPAIIEGQSPGTYEVGVYVSPLNSALDPHLLFGANVSAFVFR